MIGANIKKLRVQHGMTQKNLADKLFVSAQAVSRWENDEVEPSIGTILELAKIFGVTSDEILGIEAKEESSEKKEENEKNSQQEAPEKQEKEESTRQFLAVCENCNQPIYESNEIVREDGKVFCKKCKQKQANSMHELKLQKSRRRRIMSFILGPLPAVVSLFTIIYTGQFGDSLMWLGAITVSISMFAFISCCLLANNFVGDMTATIFSWGFVQMPGLIFTLDIDGCLWFIIVKLSLALLGILLAILCAILAVVVGGFVSLFVYPYAIIKNIKHPEKTEL